MLDLRHLLVASLALVAADAHAKCAFMPMGPVALTAANAEVGPGGGVVVGLSYLRYEDKQNDKISQKGWRFKQGSKVSEPAIRQLAPGLALYEPAGDATGSFGLIDDAQKPIIAIRRGKAKPALATPALKAAKGKLSSDNEKWGMESRLTLELAAPRPADATGLILYVGDKPANWIVLDPKSTTVDFSSGGHCSNDIPGTSVPTFGDISVAWFDSTGRVSPQSKPIGIKKG